MRSKLTVVAAASALRDGASRVPSLFALLRFNDGEETANCIVYFQTWGALAAV